MVGLVPTVTLIYQFYFISFLLPKKENILLEDEYLHCNNKKDEYLHCNN